MTLSQFGFKRLFWVVNDLSFNWNVFILFNFSFSSNVIDLFFWDILWNILTKIFDSIVIGNGDFSWNTFDSNFFFIFDNFSFFGNSFDSRLVSVFNNFFFEWNVLNSTLSLDNFLNVNDSVDLRGTLDMTGDN